MAEPKIVYGQHEAGQGTLKTYVIGFVVSVVLTVAAFAAVDTHIHSRQPAFSGDVVVGLVIGLAITQLLVQLVCFLHVGRGSKPRWNLAALAFAAIVVFILVAGSLWIMSNLNYRMMSSPSQINQYLNSQDGL